MQLSRGNKNLPVNFVVCELQPEQGTTHLVIGDTGNTLETILVTRICSRRITLAAVRRWYSSYIPPESWLFAMGTRTRNRMPWSSSAVRGSTESISSAYNEKSKCSLDARSTELKMSTPFFQADKIIPSSLKRVRRRLNNRGGRQVKRHALSNIT